MNTAHSSWVLRISRPAKRVEKTLEAVASALEFSAVSFTGSAVAADLQLAGQLCVRILIGSLLLFPLIARLNVAGSAIGQLPISLARRPRDRQLAIVAGAFSSGPRPSQATPPLGALAVQLTPEEQQPARAIDDNKAMHLKIMILCPGATVHRPVASGPLATILDAALSLLGRSQTLSLRRQSRLHPDFVRWYSEVSMVEGVAQARQG
jgi:hypothetical protein